jgi:hypothetical protein
VSYRFDRRLGRYRDVASGRLISDRVVRDGVDNLADLTSERMAGYSRALLDGSMSLADWQARMMADIKAAHVAGGVAAHGGRVQMSLADWGRVGQRVRAQYGYLRQFAQDITSGRQPLDGRLVARAQQYGQAARVAYETIKAADDRARGMTVERNVLHGRDHCAECPKLSERGWVTIGSLPPIGSRACRVRDRCTIERRFAVPKSSGVS